ncbi:transposase [Nonomuraea sp. NPDC049695]|uniref:transposase n=1 Tax=Nonomuraea sp. NPDC049695 TaxID=3154734 RepID=UPI00343406D3
MARPSKFGDEFRRDAVRLVRTTGRTCADVVRELEMNRETLRTWVREAESDDGKSGVAEAERVLPRLRLADLLDAHVQRDLPAPVEPHLARAATLGDPRSPAGSFR